MLEATNAAPTKQDIAQQALINPVGTIHAAGGLTLYEHLQYFWPEISTDAFKYNWHIEHLCRQLEEIAYRVADDLPKLYDLIINIPPGTTKTITCCVAFPSWCWPRWYWMKFIVATYSAQLSLESAELCRDLIRSDRYQQLYPEIGIKEDKDVKSNYRVIKRQWIRPNKVPRQLAGGNRFSTSVGGTLTGFHGHILIVDDPLDPNRAVSEVELHNANRWMEQTLSTRKTDKAVTPTILIMQRLHQDDPSGHILAKQKTNVKHISLPGEIRNYPHTVHPPELARNYVDELLDPVRMSWDVLADMEADMGQYGYAGQVGQDPTPPGGGMFKVDHFHMIDPLREMPADVNFIETVRYWDKAGTAGGRGAFTAGVKMSRLTDNRWIVHDVKRGRWSTEEREDIIREVAEVDGHNVRVYMEQEPGSGGKDSIQASITGLAGFAAFADRPTGDKERRADPYSVQVNNGRFMLVRGEWNHTFVEEHRFFPHGTHKDQVDAAAGAFNCMRRKRQARIIRRRR